MRTLPKILLAIALSTGIAAAHAQELADLIVPVPEAVRAEIYDQREFAIREQLYFANAYRFVTINDGLLYSSDKFQVTLSDDVQLIVETTGVQRAAEGIFIWEGLIVPPGGQRLPITRASGEPLSSTQSDEIYKQLYGISIFVMEWDRNSRTGEVRPVMYRPDSTSFDPPTPENRLSDGAWRSYQPNAFRTVLARIVAPRSRKVFLIESIGDDSEYHLLFEENTERRGSGNIDSTFYDSTPVFEHERQLHADYELFLERLENRLDLGQRRQ